MPVPVSEIPVTFSVPGFLLLGRQDMRELLSLGTLTLCLISVLAVSVDATGSQSRRPVNSPRRAVLLVVGAESLAKEAQVTLHSEAPRFIAFLQEQVSRSVGIIC